MKKSIKDRQLVWNKCTVPVTDLNLPSSYTQPTILVRVITYLSQPKLFLTQIENHPESPRYPFLAYLDNQKSTASPPYPSLAYFTNTEALRSDTLSKCSSKLHS